MKILSTVSLLNLCPQIAFIMPAIEEVYKSHGAEAIVTSANDLKHSRKSLHYSGQAIDLRIWNVPPFYRSQLLKDLREALPTSEFDIVLEEDHIHLEWQPKRRG